MLNNFNGFPRRIFIGSSSGAGGPIASNSGQIIYDSLMLISSDRQGALAVKLPPIVENKYVISFCKYRRTASYFLCKFVESESSSSRRSRSHRSRSRSRRVAVVVVVVVLEEETRRRRKRRRTQKENSNKPNLTGGENKRVAKGWRRPVV